MDAKSVTELFEQCEQNKFWGTIRLNFQDGRLMTADVTQTLKHTGVEQKLLIVLSPIRK